LRFRIDSRGKSSRKRANDDEGDVTYINDANKVFNKKVGLPSSVSPFPFSSSPLSDHLLLLSLYSRIVRSPDTTTRFVLSFPISLFVVRGTDP